MQLPKVTVAVPTLGDSAVISDCLRALANQTLADFEVYVVDNSGKNQTEGWESSWPGVKFLRNARNVGYGAAINQVWRASQAEFIAALNDDAVPAPEWLAALVAAMPRFEIGMAASQVRMPGGMLDSAGMNIARDGSSRQRGHGESPADYSKRADVLCPSGSAALYRRAMLEETGGFEESFFLYCEDTDLGLRARWRGWECVYAPGAVVEHRYSQSAGRASRLKAYHVERNRLWLAVRNFPRKRLLLLPWFTAVRYLYHLLAMLGGRGKAGEFVQGGGSAFALAGVVVRAHWDTLKRLPALLRERRAIAASRRIEPLQMSKMLDRHRISLRRVAEL
ncbi:MAG: glycosyltransferase family 2 protein [Bryobacteraceae bacterium]|nr:glycosyltransferase family 2 protein [Bryobacteraceae bacterium]